MRPGIARWSVPTHLVSLSSSVLEEPAVHPHSDRHLFQVWIFLFCLKSFSYHHYSAVYIMLDSWTWNSILHSIWPGTPCYSEIDPWLGPWPQNPVIPHHPKIANLIECWDSLLKHSRNTISEAILCKHRMTSFRISICIEKRLLDSTGSPNERIPVHRNSKIEAVMAHLPSLPMTHWRTFCFLSLQL